MTLAEFKAFFPFGEFDAITDTQFAVAVERADLYFDLDRWGDSYKAGFANCAAHFLVLLQSQATKSIKQESAGDVAARSISGAVSMSRDSQMINREASDPFMRTSYGQQYISLRDAVGMGGIA